MFCGCEVSIRIRIYRFGLNEEILCKRKEETIICNVIYKVNVFELFCFDLLKNYLHYFSFKTYITYVKLQ